MNGTLQRLAANYKTGRFSPLGWENTAETNVSGVNRELTDQCAFLGEQMGNVVILFFFYVTQPFN